MNTKVTFDPAPQKVMEYPAHYRCKQCPTLIVLALNEKTVVMIKKGSRSERPGEVITGPLSPFDNTSIWERIPGQSTFYTE